MKLTRVQTGDAGEYAVAAELAVRGWMVELPRRNAPSIDLYAHNPTEPRTCGIQVKTRTRGEFRLSDRLMELGPPTADEWVTLVTLGTPGTRSHFYVVPRNHVAAAMLAYAGNREDAGRGWKAKYFGPEVFSGYDETWELIERWPASDAPWLMHDWVGSLLADQGREDVLAFVRRAQSSA